MKAKVIDAIKALFYSWAINLFLISAVSAVCVLVGVPVIVFMKTGELRLLPDIDLVYKAAKGTLWAAFSTGTILWIATFFEKDE